MNNANNRKLITFIEADSCGIYAINIADFGETAYDKLKPLIESIREKDKSVALDESGWNDFFRKLDVISDSCRDEADKDDLAYFNEWVIRQFSVYRSDDEKRFCYLDDEKVSYHKDILEEDDSAYLIGNATATKRARKGGK
jgi:hypothetical protein